MAHSLSEKRGEEVVPARIRTVPSVLIHFSLFRTKASTQLAKPAQHP